MKLCVFRQRARFSSTWLPQWVVGEEATNKKSSATNMLFWKPAPMFTILLHFPLQMDIALQILCYTYIKSQYVDKDFSPMKVNLGENLRIKAKISWLVQLTSYFWQKGLWPEPKGEIFQVKRYFCGKIKKGSKLDSKWKCSLTLTMQSLRNKC